MNGATLPMPGREIVITAAGLNRVRVGDLLGRGGGANVRFARAEAAYMLRSRLGWSYERIGRYLGGRRKQPIERMIRRYERVMSGGLDAAARAFS